MPRKPRSSAPKPAKSKGSPSRKTARRARGSAPDVRADSYRHPEAQLATRPDVGTQAEFRRKKPAKTYKYDSSLSPALDWDGQNPARERGEELIRAIQEAPSLEAARAAADELAALARPFLNWSGKAEGLSFDVPTLPLFVHERLSTQAILETLKRHKRDKQESLDLFGDPQLSLTDRLLKAYEHKDRWVNRLILGDSLVVMNSLLEYEGMGGQAQMIYIDPPYGVKFGSNFQPFVRNRDVKHNDDADMTREPEMVQAYRDTWELGLHSYLTYLRDRLLVARELLKPSGSVFVQISDENLHHVQEVMDDVFGPHQRAGVLTFRKTSGLTADRLAQNSDFILWYCRNITEIKFNPLFVDKGVDSDLSFYRYVQLPNGERRSLRAGESLGDLGSNARLFAVSDLTSSHAYSQGKNEVEFNGGKYLPGDRYWSTSPLGFQRLIAAGRIHSTDRSLRFVRFMNDFPVQPLTANWTDTITGQYSEDRLYVVQTAQKVIQRCILMTTDPGDLVVDPTCGSGTTAYAAEQWGRRWITIDTSRVPLALTRQRILTATYPWYDLKDAARGPAAGFVYERKENSRGEEVGGIVPHITLKSIANGEPPKEEVLVDRPEQDKSITRVSGPFVVEATIPTPVDYEGDGIEDSGVTSTEEYGSFVERMLEVLRRNPKIQIGGGRTLGLRNVRPPAKSMSISAEAVVDAASLPDGTLLNASDRAHEQRGNKLDRSSRPVAIVFGPENGAVSDKLVFNAAREANARNYAHLIVIGFAIQPSAREMIDKAADALGISASYVSVTPDVMMGDLLKTMRSSQIFSVSGLPDVDLVRRKRAKDDETGEFMVRLNGLDTFNPATMESESLEGEQVPAWFLDTDYNELSFHVSQAFFPRTEAWDSLKRALRATHEESVWEHLSGTESAPFDAAPNARIAVKVIDNRGNELMVVKSVAEAIKQNA